ncbi:MAG: ComEC/Rec2 family competence protein, partial [Planctomycetes bacterium]|nr:ComEC/Rec2 family competence protein [Planctomycetota bacterium]
MDSTFPPGLLPQGREPGSPRDASGARRRRPLFWLALAFATGIAADDVLTPGLPALGGLLISAALAALGAGVLLRGERLRGLVCFAAAAFAGFAGGTFTHALKARFPGASDVSRRTPAASSIAWLEGAVVEVRRPQVNGARGRELWTIELSSLGAKPDDLAPASGLVQLAAPACEPNSPPEEILEGQRLRVLARLEAPASATLPDIFDRANYLARQGIRRVGESARGRVEVLGLTPWWRVDLHLRRWSGALAARNDERLGPERAGLLNALLLGRRDNIGPGDSEAFARTGTAHLLAISGLHVQAVAALMGWLLARLGFSKRRAALAVLVFSIAYALFTGAQPPVVRAVAMIAVYAGAFLFFRAPDPLTTLGAAALGILLFAPDDLFLAGFQLSVLAVLALVTLYPSLEAAWLRWRGIPEAWIVDPEEKTRLRWSRGLRRACFVSLAAWAGSAPAVAWHMGNFTFFSLGTNIVAVPLSMLGMAAGAVGMLPGLSTLAPALNLPFDLLLGLNRTVSAWPLASLDVPPPPLAVCVIYAAVMCWVWMGRARSATFPRMALMLPAAFAALAVSSFFRAPPENPRLTVFDLGRGRAALVETPGGEAALIDAGGEGQG